nr:hypothetical protein [uncultured Rhodopila sp.]
MTHHFVPSEQAENRRQLEQLLLKGRFFVREDVNKPENRANLALAMACLVPGFKSRLCDAWGLPPDVRIVRLDWNKGGRPDAFIFSSQNDLLHPVEAECKALVNEQVERFRGLFGREPLCITGDPLPSGYVGTTWTRIKLFAEVAGKETNNQDHKDALTSLDCAVSDVLGLLGRKSPAVILQIPDELPDDAFFRSLALPLIELEMSRPGCIQAKAVRPGNVGLILRLPAAIVNKPRVGVSLVSLEATRRGYLNLPDATQLRSYLRSPLMSWVDKWEQLLADYPQLQPCGHRRLLLNVASGAVPSGVFADAYADLAKRVRVL